MKRSLFALTLYSIAALLFVVTMRPELLTDWYGTKRVRPVIPASISKAQKSEEATTDRSTPKVQKVTKTSPVKQDGPIAVPQVVQTAGPAVAPPAVHSTTALAISKTKKDSKKTEEPKVPASVRARAESVALHATNSPDSPIVRLLNPDDDLIAGHQIVDSSGSWRFVKMVKRLNTAGYVRSEDLRIK